MSKSSFAGRFSVGARIYTGFIAILLLLCGIAAVGMFGLDNVSTGFHSYAKVSDDAAFNLEIKNEMAGARYAVRNYGLTGQTRFVEQLRVIQPSLTAKFAKAVDRTLNPERKEMLRRANALYLKWSESADTMVETRARRTALYDEMVVLGNGVTADQARIVATAMAEGDMTTAAIAGVVQEKLLVSRLSAVKFFLDTTPENGQAALARQGEYWQAIEGLEHKLTSVIHRKSAEEAMVKAGGYADALAKVITAAEELQKLTDRLFEDGEAIAALLDQVVASQAATRMETLGAADDTIARTETISFTVALVALGFGLLVAFVVARSIVSPVVSMTGAMTSLADGDLTAEIPATEDGDEVGRMARAVLVFKDNAIQKKRMDEAEAVRIATERRDNEERRKRETAIGDEIASLIDAVSKGDLDRRIDLAGKDGFYRSMSDGVNRLTDTVSAVVADVGEVLSALAAGDLTKRVSRDYQGAFQKVKEDINATSTRLAAVVGDIASAADAISTAASEVSSGSTDLAERTEQQASSLEETAASMEQLSGTVRSNAENARRANRMADDATRAAESGGGVAESAISAMKRIEEASRKITEIIGVIDEIAFQTNLLALNAAVEAARAGDAGRGFAVVAQEVRQLAQRSAHASKEIKALILDSDGQVRDGVELVQKAGEALGGIVEGVREVAAIISEMATASGEQASALDEINAAVAQMDEMTQKNAALVEETTAAAHSMADQARDLKARVGTFRLDGNAGRVTARSAEPMAAATSAPTVRRVVTPTAGATRMATARPAAKPAASARPAAAPKPKAAPVRTAKPANASTPPAPSRSQADLTGGLKTEGALRHAGSDFDDDEWKEF